MRRKIVSLLLVLAMVLCLMPTALASEKGSFAAGENKALTLDGKAAGTFNIAGDETKGFTLLNKRGKYVALEDGWITESRSAFTWSYDGGLYAQSYVENGGHHWWRWWAPRSYRAVSLYLAADENGLTTSSAKVAAITAEAETEAQLKNAVTDAEVYEHYDRGYSGWFFWLWSRPEYHYTIKAVTEGVTVAKVEHGDSLEALTQGSSFTSRKKLTEFYIQITDSNGKVTQWLYKDGDVTPVAVDDDDDKDLTDYLVFSSDDLFTLQIQYTEYKIWKTEAYGGNTSNKFEYSTDGATWKEWEGTEEKALKDSADDLYKFYLRGKMEGKSLNFAEPTTLIMNSQNSNKVSCSGNIMALLDYSDPDSVEMGAGAFANLFCECTRLVSAPSLPSTQLAAYCYADMFYGCTSLATAPELKATKLTESCYQDMFMGCTSLATAPELKATELAESCYQNMFRGCTALKKASALPAKTLTKECYAYMFWDCTSLTETPELKATELADSCYAGMFCGCTALENASALPAKTLTKECYENMFSGCEALETAPTMEVEGFAEDAEMCCWEMFEGCKKLSSASNIQLSAKTLAASCYMGMFSGCSSLTAAPDLPATTLANNCYYVMFENCTSLVTAPSELPATTLVSMCYNGMFEGCIALTTPPEMAEASKAEESCYTDMFNGCTKLIISTSTGTNFFKAPSNADSDNSRDMFAGCGGSGFTDTPNGDTTYYYGEAKP